MGFPSEADTAIQAQHSGPTAGRWLPATSQAPAQAPALLLATH